MDADGASVVGLLEGEIASGCAGVVGAGSLKGCVPASALWGSAMRGAM